MGMHGTREDFLKSADWARLRGRYEAFWRREPLKAPLVWITAPASGPWEADDRRPADDAALEDWMLNPDRVLPRLRRQLLRTYHAGDAFPLAFPVSTGLAAIQAAYHGGKYGIHNGSGWCEPIIDDWATRAPLTVDENNRWWRATLELMRRGTELFADSAAIGIPDIQGGGQIVDLLRGTERLAMDLLEAPDEIHRILEEVDQAFMHYWRECHRPLQPRQHGYADWLRIWSDLPMVTVECDFCCMISPDMFREFFIPSLRRQTGWIERSLYHLDGPGAVRHLDALLELETLDGIQWVPGAGAAPMLEWLPLLQRIQAAGKLLTFSCKPDEVLPLVAALEPDGLCIQTGCKTPEEADQLAGEIGI